VTSKKERIDRKPKMKEISTSSGKQSMMRKKRSQKTAGINTRPLPSKVPSMGIIPEPSKQKPLKSKIAYPVDNLGLPAIFDWERKGLGQLFHHVDIH
jgi:hypothetical protein